MFLCQICHKYARRTLSEILRHIRDMHKHFTGKVRCGVNNCPSTVTSYESLRQHLYKQHKDILKTTADDLESDPREEVSNDGGVDSSPETTSRDDHDIPMDCSDTTSSSHTQQEYDTQIEAAKFVLKLRDGRKLPQTVTNEITQDVSSLVESVVENLKESVLKLIPIPESNQDDFEKIFNFSHMFKGLETQHLQEKFVRENFNYVVS